MPIDQTGTNPGLVAQEHKPSEVHIRCKNPSCDSINAIEITPPGQPGVRRYQCSKCKHSHGVQVGGAFDL